MSYQDYKKNGLDFDISTDLDEDESSTASALRCILEAWEEGVRDGISPEHLAQAAIYASLCDLVETYGEETTIKMTEDLIERIKLGEFTLNRTVQ